MSHAEFLMLVTRMRMAQKTYFQYRKPEMLREARGLETAVDKALSECKLACPKEYRAEDLPPQT